MQAAILAVLLAGSAPPLSEPVREVVTRVCGSCHYPDFFDDASGTLVEAKVLAKQPQILDRLQRPVGTAGRMPPKRTPITISDDERSVLIEFFSKVAAEDDVMDPPIPPEDLTGNSKKFLQ